MMGETTIEEKVRASELLRRELQGFRCLVCGHDEFIELDVPDQSLQPNLTLYSGDDPVGKKHVPLLAIACTHCGRIEQFAEQALLKRIRLEGNSDGRDP